MRIRMSFFFYFCPRHSIMSCKTTLIYANLRSILGYVRIAADTAGVGESLS
jgi:hypothetical protein